MKNFIAPMLALVTGLAGAALVGCDEVEEIESEIDCFAYCEKAADCNGDVDRDQCEMDCEEALMNCQSDELDEAQMQVDECSEASCDEFVGCTIDAGAQCFFGL